MYCRLRFKSQNLLSSRHLEGRHPSYREPLFGLVKNPHFMSWHEIKSTRGCQKEARGRGGPSPASVEANIESTYPQLKRNRTPLVWGQLRIMSWRGADHFNVLEYFSRNRVPRVSSFPLPRLHGTFPLESEAQAPGGASGDLLSFIYIRKDDTLGTASYIGRRKR